MFRKDPMRKHTLYLLLFPQDQHCTSFQVIFTRSKTWETFVKNFVTKTLAVGMFSFEKIVKYMLLEFSNHNKIT